VRELSVAIAEYLRYREMEHRGPAETAVMEEHAKTLHAKVGKQAPDPFEQSVDKAIETLEKFIRPRMELKLRSA
jgi:hypothetical protein